MNVTSSLQTTISKALSATDWGKEYANCAPVVERAYRDFQKQSQAQNAIHFKSPCYMLWRNGQEIEIGIWNPKPEDYKASISIFRAVWIRGDAVETDVLFKVCNLGFRVLKRYGNQVALFDLAPKILSPLFADVSHTVSYFFEQKWGDRFSNYKDRTIDELVCSLIQMITLLVSLHRRGLCDGDVKLSNLVLNEGNLRIIDLETVECFSSNRGPKRNNAPYPAWSRALYDYSIQLSETDLVGFARAILDRINGSYFENWNDPQEVEAFFLKAISKFCGKEQFALIFLRALYYKIIDTSNQFHNALQLGTEEQFLFISTDDIAVMLSELLYYLRVENSRPPKFRLEPTLTMQELRNRASRVKIEQPVFQVVEKNLMHPSEGDKETVFFLDASFPGKGEVLAVLVNAVSQRREFFSERAVFQLGNIRIQFNWNQKDCEKNEVIFSQDEKIKAIIAQNATAKSNTSSVQKIAAS